MGCVASMHSNKAWSWIQQPQLRIEGLRGRAAVERKGLRAPEGLQGHLGGQAAVATPCERTPSRPPGHAALTTPLALRFKRTGDVLCEVPSARTGRGTAAVQEQPQLQG
jgi:hypothetical protein